MLVNREREREEVNREREKRERESSREQNERSLRGKNPIERNSIEKRVGKIYGKMHWKDSEKTLWKNALERKGRTRGIDQQTHERHLGRDEYTMMVLSCE